VNDRGKHTVVVGVDGSPRSVVALRWAVEYATSVGAAVRAITGWQHPLRYRWESTMSDDDLAERAGRMLGETVRAALGADPPVEVQESVVAGHPAQVLIDASRDAQLLVVGSHGYAAVSGALLGAVSQYCVQHARCPVVVVRD
jgi:nucleotide-binding universal stress UspA family protein